jgi:hypothetical protein
MDVVIIEPGYRGVIAPCNRLVVGASRNENQFIKRNLDRDSAQID